MSAARKREPHGPQGSQPQSQPQERRDEQSTRVEEYTRVYRDHHARLVGYARSLTGNTWLAEDLVAEAHFRVWRRISAGHQVDDPAAYLATTIRNLAATVGRAPRELPQQPNEEWHWAEGTTAAATADPQQRVAYADLLAEVMKQLPQRWAEALWLAEVEDLPVATVGERIGSNPNATAVLLHRAREGMRQAFLRSQPGVPADPACAQYWENMPAFVRGVAGRRNTAALAAHTDGCSDCRDRLTGLELANRRLPLLLGPALLALSGTGALRFLLPAVLGGGATTAAATSTTAATSTATAASAVGAKAAAGATAAGAGAAAKGAAGASRGSSGLSSPAGVGVVAVGVVAAAAAIALAMAGSSSTPKTAHQPVPTSPQATAAQLASTPQAAVALPTSPPPSTALPVSAPQSSAVPIIVPPPTTLQPTTAPLIVPQSSAAQPSPSQASASQTTASYSPPPSPSPSLSPTPSQSSTPTPSPTPSPQPSCIFVADLVKVCW